MKRAANSESDEDDEQRVPRSTQLASSLSSLREPVSPPRRRCEDTHDDRKDPVPSSTDSPPSEVHDLAAIEAGEVEVTDHLELVSTELKKRIRPLSQSQSTSRLRFKDWANLYRRNEHAEGHHFVIHQHDHPIAGPHYDLRLQFSKTSSVSWSVMYGMPGDPNSKRINRTAIETRVHCLWNHLLETASSKTGSLIIWDTGEYEILPYSRNQSPVETDNSQSESSQEIDPKKELASDSAKLREAFQNRKIRLRLHGSRLPKDYTITLRMEKTSNYVRPVRRRPKRRRRALEPTQMVPRAPSTSDSERQLSPSADPLTILKKKGTTGSEPETEQKDHSDDDPDLQVRKNNAYPGSSNTIGSVHQRRWFLSLDREGSGFESTYEYGEESGSRKRTRKWVRPLLEKPGPCGFDPFYVHGPDSERSVVTGRLGRDVLDDEHVEGFLPRKGWRPVLN